MNLEDHFKEASDALREGHHDAYDIYLYLVDALISEVEGMDDKQKTLSNVFMFAEKLHQDQKNDEALMLVLAFFELGVVDRDHHEYWELRYILSEPDDDYDYLTSFSHYYGLAKEKNIRFDFNEREMITKNLKLSLELDPKANFHAAYRVVEDYCKLLLELEPQNLFALKTLASIYWKYEINLKELKEIYKIILDIEPDNIEMTLGISTLRYYEGDWEYAQDILKEYIETYQDSYRISLQCAWIYRNLEWEDYAEYYSDKASNEGENCKDVVLIKAREFSRPPFSHYAFLLVNKALEIAPDDEEVILTKIHFSMITNDMNAAYLCVDNSLIKDPTNIKLLNKKLEICEKQNNILQLLEVS